jgi:hypothetical protein
MRCPQCGAAMAEYGGEGGIHPLWSCDACPLVAFEYHGVEDLRHAASVLDSRLHVTEEPDPPSPTDV